MQDVYRAEQHLDRLAKRQVQIVAFDNDIIARAGIAWIQAQGVVRADVHGIGFAQSAVFPWKAEAPLPLLADGLGLGRTTLLLSGVLDNLIRGIRPFLRLWTATMQAHLSLAAGPAAIFSGMPAAGDEI